MTSSAPLALEINEYDTAGARAIQDELFSLYARIYADQLSNPFYSVERFAERFAGHTSRVGYRLVAGRLEGALIGYAYGVPLPAATRWWEGLRGPITPASIAEDGTRTFALNEIMVDGEWRGRGVAHALHDALLRGRPERRATLLVDPENSTARNAYLGWGWKPFAQLQPFPDAPVYDALILDLSK